jgi:hypothetical protein
MTNQNLAKRKEKIKCKGKFIAVHAMKAQGGVVV